MDAIVRVESSAELVNAGDYTGLARSTTDELLVRRWLESKQKSASTQEQYARAWRSFSAFVSKPLQAVRFDDLQDWHASLTGTPATRKAKAAAVRSLFAFATKTGYLHANPAVLLDLDKVADTKHRKVVDELAILRMLDACQTPRERALVHALYSSGARVSELLALTWQDVQPRQDGGAVLQIVFGKGKKSRQAGVSKGAYAALLALRDESTPASAYVFSTRTGAALDRQAAHRTIKGIAKRAGVDAAFSAHWLRHSHATHALLRKAPVQDVMEQLGHSSLAVTSSYAHAARSSSDVLVL